MRVFGFVCIAISLAGVAFLQRNLSARPYQTATGELHRKGPDIIMVNRAPCEDREKIITFSGKMKLEVRGTKTCEKDGRTYEEVRVTQCGGKNDKNDTICKSIN